jgi:hypothetical protein
MLTITLTPKAAARLEGLVREFNTTKTMIDIMVDTLVEGLGIDPATPRGNISVRPGEDGKTVLQIEGLMAPAPPLLPSETDRPAHRKKQA